MNNACEAFCGPDPVCISRCVRAVNISASVSTVIQSDTEDTIQGYVLYEILFDYLPVVILAVVIILVFWALGYYGGATTTVLILFVLGLFALAAVLKNYVIVNYLTNRQDKTRTDALLALEGALINSTP